MHSKSGHDSFPSFTESFTDMGAIHHGVPKDLVAFLQEETGIEAFVETGTLTGESAEWASMLFDEVVTIEAKEDIATRARERLSKFSNVRVVHGDSSRVLSQVLRDTQWPAILWLDAHWMGPGSNTAGEGGVECPVSEEIQYARRGDIVIVDDARLFMAPPPRPHNPMKWPQLKEIVSLLSVDGQDVFIYEDTFIAVPKRHSAALVLWLQEQVTKAWLNP